MGGEILRIGGRPSERQREFFASRAKYTAYGGARGGGKSWALRRKLVSLCLRYAGIRCLLIRRTLSELRANHLMPLLSEYGRLITYSERESAISFPNGSKIFLGYCARDGDTLRYQGQEYDVIAIDEATQLSEYQFSVFGACLRGVNDFPKRMYLTCNPGGVGHAWVKRLFIDRRYNSGENGEDYLFIPARVYDNKALLEADPEYEGRLRALPERLRRAWLDGSWDVFEGQFFPEFSEELHVVDAAVIPKNTERFAAFDYGLDMLALLLLSRDGDGNVYAERELCRSGLTLGEAACEIAEFLSGTGAEYAVASPDLWNRRQDTGMSGFEIMSAARKMPPMIPADNRRVPGWRVVREYLSTGDGTHLPRLRISKNCPELIRSMQGLLCDGRRPEDASSEPHSLTHAPEALRYGLMSRAVLKAAPEDDALPFRFSGSRNATHKHLGF